MTSQELANEGIAACKAGRHQQARDLLTQAVALDPNNEAAWLWLSGVVGTDEERLICLEEVLAINPGSAAAQRGRDALRAKGVEPAPAPLPTGPPAIKRLGIQRPAPPDRVEPGPAVTAETAAETPAMALPPEAGGAAAGPQAAAGKARDDVSPAVFWLAVVVTGLAAVCVAAVLLYQWLGPGIRLPGARPTASASDIIAVAYEQLAAYNAEDIDRYMATVHSRARGVTQVRSTLVDLFGRYDLQARLTGVKLVKLTRSEARLSFTLETRKIRGPAFRDNRITGEFILRQDGGQWKLYDQEVDNVEYLN